MHDPVELRVIAGDGITLEPQTVEHCDEMFAVLSDPAIYEHENEPPASAEWLRQRFRRLESRLSPDARELWLNWVIRLPGAQLAGYVQATVREDRSAAIAYELSSAYWGRNIGYSAVTAMIGELAGRYRVHTLTAVLKTSNTRSRRLLERLGFVAVPAPVAVARGAAPDEIMMRKALASACAEPHAPHGGSSSGG
jgi:[ribosomal protein S5]-alanine N-acetyltransferase